MSSDAVFFVLTYLSVLFLTTNTADEQGPGQGSMTGHFKPLGRQRQPEGDIKTVSMFLDPPNFYAESVKPSIPVLFKGAAKHFPAYQLWDDKYLE